MALTHEGKDLFTRAEPGIPAGQMMRLYRDPN